MSGVLDSFTEVSLSVRQLFLGKQNLRETNYRSQRSAQFMRQMGDGRRPVLRQFTKFSILLLEISGNFFQRLDRLLPSIILPFLRNIRC